MTKSEPKKIKSFFDMPDSEKRKIILKAVREANEEQKKLMEEPKKKYSNYPAGFQRWKPELMEPKKECSCGGDNVGLKPHEHRIDCPIHGEKQDKECNKLILHECSKGIWDGKMHFKRPEPTTPEREQDKECKCMCHKAPYDNAEDFIAALHQECIHCEPTPTLNNSWEEVDCEYGVGVTHSVLNPEKVKALLSSQKKDLIEKIMELPKVLVDIRFAPDDPVDMRDAVIVDDILQALKEE